MKSAHPVHKESPVLREQWGQPVQKATRVRWVQRAPLALKVNPAHPAHKELPVLRVQLGRPVQQVQQVLPGTKDYRDLQAKLAQ